MTVEDDIKAIAVLAAEARRMTAEARQHAEDCRNFWHEARLRALAQSKEGR